ncbi:MAG: fumarate hydratase [Acidobacteria bacterium]|nr:fumarate hydratase [Acidobacteriota bacterium]
MDLGPIEARLAEAILRASTHIPEDVERALARGLDQETTDIARSQLRAMLDNVAIARDEARPICQDTGIVSFYLTAGYDFPALGRIVRALENVLVGATRDIPLRPNTSHPLRAANPGNNTGPFMPVVDVVFVEGDQLVIDVLPKGGGSENCSGLFLLTPAEGIKGFRKRLVDHVQKAGGKPCPPLVLGVGVGSPADLALRLAKRSLTRPLGEHNADPEIAQLERDMLADVNALGIGPNGLGGRTTALDVHVEVTYRHPASYPVAVAVQCWADRRARVIVDKNLHAALS